MRNLLWATALLLPLYCSAQTAPAPDQGPPPQAMQASSGNPSANAATGMDGGMAMLRERLQLTPEQLVTWSRYAEAVDAYTKHFYEERPAAAFVSDPAPRQVGRMVDSLQNRLALLEQMEDSAKAVYATLSPEQQKTANQFWLASVPVFASGTAANCPSNMDRKTRPDGERPNRRGGGMGGPSGM